MKTWHSILYGSLLGVFISIIFAAGIYLASRQPQGNPIELLPAPTPSPLMVQVAGQVQAPGLYSLPRGSRMQDAIQAAGGLTNQADQAAVNLAARLKDGEKVVVPAVGALSSVPKPVESSSEGSQPGSQNNPESVSFPIDLNLATLEELDALPGIGPTRAQDILRYREEHGGFKTVEELKEIPGIGDATFDRLKEYITVETEP
jgi:competence protein ComEA